MILEYKTTEDKVTLEEIQINMTKRFVNDCHMCKFLGQWKEYDLYYCPQGGYPTVLAMYYDDSNYYDNPVINEISGMALADSTPSLTIAKKRALHKGYIK